jgi:hypothetical protein
VVEACKAAARSVAATVPNTFVLDLLHLPESDDDSLWWDKVHYRGALALKIEDVIVDVLERKSTASTAHAQ